MTKHNASCCYCARTLRETHHQVLLPTGAGVHHGLPELLQAEGAAAVQSNVGAVALGQAGGLRVDKDRRTLRHTGTCRAPTCQLCPWQATPQFTSTCQDSCLSHNSQQNQSPHVARRCPHAVLFSIAYILLLSIIGQATQHDWDTHRQWPLQPTHTYTCTIFDGCTPAPEAAHTNHTSTTHHSTERCPDPTKPACADSSARPKEGPRAAACTHLRQHSPTKPPCTCSPSPKHAASSTRMHQCAHSLTPQPKPTAQAAHVHTCVSTTPSCATLLRGRQQSSSSS